MNPPFPSALLFLIPLAVLIGLGVLWWYLGRDPEKRKDIAFEYMPPKGLTPAEAGVLIDEKADEKDVLATFFDLASRRHFRIEDIGDDMRFHLSQDYEEDPGLERHEKTLLRTIFARKAKVMFSDMKENLKAQYPSLKKELYDAVSKKGFFQKNPEEARSDYLSIAAILYLVGLALFFLKLWKFPPGNPWEPFLSRGFLSLYVSGIFFVLFAHYMPKKTQRGNEIYERLLGLQKFLRNPLAAEGKYEGYADEETYFERLLPYAIAFDATSDWLSVNVHLYEKRPPLYVDSKRNFRDFIEKIREELVG